MATSTVTTGQQSIPAELTPYFTGSGIAGEGLLPKAQQVFGRDYASAYGNTLANAGLEGAGRIAGLSPTEQQAGQQIANLGQPSQFGQGQAAYGQGLGSLGQAQNIYQNAANNSFTGNAVNQYMSPYMQQVVDLQKNEALRDAQKKLVGADLGSARQGTYGGARNALMQSEADRNLQTQMATIQATGSQNAFQNAQQQYNANQGQQFQAGAGLGQLGQTYGTLGQGLGYQGALQQQADIGRSAALGAYGGTERQVAQQQLDAQYQDQMRALGYPEQQLGNMSNVLRGVPLGDAFGTQVTTQAPPSFASQLAGIGLGGLSLANMIGKQGT
jgi:hypothetical protein